MAALGEYLKASRQQQIYKPQMKSVVEKDEQTNSFSHGNDFRSAELVGRAAAYSH
jgi:hypothetical protein